MINALEVKGLLTGCEAFKKASQVDIPEGDPGQPWTQKLSDLLHINQVLDSSKGYQDRLPAAEDVLNGTSIAVPYPAIRGAGGAAAGALTTAALASIFDPVSGAPDAAAAHKKLRNHHIAEALGGLAGAGAATARDISASGILQRLKSKFGV